MWFIPWFIFALVVGALGSDRKIGFWGAFLLSVILSPLIGLIIVLCSTSKGSEKMQENIEEMNKRQAAASSLSDLERAKNMLDNGAITQEEFNKIKRSVIGE